MPTPPIRDEEKANGRVIDEKSIIEESTRWIEIPRQRRSNTRILLGVATLLAFFFLPGPGSSFRQHNLSSSSSKSWSGARDWSSFDNLFAFGDSYTSYNSENRYDDPPNLCMVTKAGDKFTRKPNWITFMSEVYTPKHVQTVNFAEGGSTVDRDAVPPFALGSTLKDEVEVFATNYGEKKPASVQWDPSKTLFSLWFGVNDITVCHVNSKPYGELMRPPLPKVFESYAASVKRLYSFGARHFLFLTAPPFDRSLAVDPTTWASIRQLATIEDISAFNSRVFGMVENLRAARPDLQASVFDAHRFFSAVLRQPTDFEATVRMTNTTGICNEAEDSRQPGPLDYVYEKNICRDGNLIQSYAWTPLHATYPMHNATGRQVVEDCFGGKGPKGFCS